MLQINFQKVFGLYYYFYKILSENYFSFGVGFEYQFLILGCALLIFLNVFVCEKVRF